MNTVLGDAKHLNNETKKKKEKKNVNKTELETYLTVSSR